MVGRRPAPTALKVLRGNPGQRRLNQHEPVPAAPATADPPAGLPDAALLIWQALAPELVRLGVLTVVDRDEFALGCRLRALGMAALEQSDENWHALGHALQMLRQSSSIFARFGIGASDRSRISVVGPKKPESRWAGLIGDKKA
jgi:phage terminase small subunit